MYSLTKKFYISLIACGLQSLVTGDVMAADEVTKTLKASASDGRKAARDINKSGPNEDNCDRLLTATTTFNAAATARMEILEQQLKQTPMIDGGAAMRSAYAREAELFTEGTKAARQSCGIGAPGLGK